MIAKKFEYQVTDLDEDMARFCTKELRDCDDIPRLFKVGSNFYQRIEARARKSAKPRQWVNQHPVIKLLMTRLRMLCCPEMDLYSSAYDSADTELAFLICETKIAHKKEVEAKAT